MPPHAETASAGSFVPGLPVGKLEWLIGKPPRRWTADDLVTFVREKSIHSLSLLHVGGDGWLKTLDFVIRSEEHLRDVLDAGERADGSSLFQGTGIDANASDIALRPRIESAFLDPFSKNPRLALVCGHYAADGSPLAVSPDTILRRAHERLIREARTELWALGEVEYFLGKRAEERDIYGADDRGYHATAPFVFGEKLRREAMDLLGDMGVPVKYGHSEVGYVEADQAEDLIWEQHEIELALAPLPTAAEAVVLTQWVLRNLAHERGMRCSFDPIVRAGHAGSGLHFHLAPVRGNRNLGGMGPKGALADEARWLLAGLVSCGGSLMAFGNRTADSFVRLRQGKEAPETITWGPANRRALVRIPLQATTGEGRVVTPPTIEFRLPDGSVHPHFLLAAVTQAMLHFRGRQAADVDALLDRTRAIAGSPSAGASPSVPRDFEEVARGLTAQRGILEADGVFPHALIDGQLRHLRAATAVSSG